MFRPVPGDHCERCLIPVQQTFHANLCKRFHGAEYLCPACVTYIDSKIPKLLNYLKTYGGCLFDEIEFAEERLNITVVRDSS